jgi:thiol-disulfide isomerase/thioredoxin
LKNTLIILIPFFLLTQCSKSQQAEKSFRALDIDGNSFFFNNSSKKPFVLIFWATYCEPCIAEFPHVNDMYLKYKNDITFAAICIDNYSLSPLLNIKEELNLSIPIINDIKGTIKKSFDVKAVPFTLITDADLSVLLKHTGMLQDMEQELRKAISLSANK